MRRISQTIKLACAVGAALLAISTRAADVPPTSPPETTYTQEGAKTCLKCHEEPSVRSILQTPHAVRGDARTPFAQHDCESCHGPSEAHSLGHGRNRPLPDVVFIGPNASPVAKRNEVCLNCHQSGLRINWQGSPHDSNDIACTNCHSPHQPKDPVLLKTSQAQVCFNCHKQQRAESFLYSHHPVREGLVACGDCHNPHGSPGPKQLKEFTVNETCYNCHTEKRGPMLWEHQPVREDCMNCHTPHGSTEQRLMKERMNFMCSSCHSAVGNFSGGAFGGGHSLPGRLAGSATFNSALANQRQCLNCHSEIHGSNSPNGTYFFR